MDKALFVGLKHHEIPIGESFILNAEEKLGFGSFGDVYSGRIRSNSQPIAIKLEYIHETPTLFNEANILTHLNEIERIPKLIWSGNQGNYNILIMNLLGSSLQNLMKQCQGKFTLATTLKISIQILEILRQIHDKGVILRYLKPGNMVIGIGDYKNFVYLIDFGIAKYYSHYGMHIPYKTHKDYIMGNRHFVSININKKNEASRRDDIESLGYNLVYFMKGILPWSKLRIEEQILFRKINISLELLCEGLPYEFTEFIGYARRLEFTERPNYYYLKELLIQAAKKNGIDLDKVEYDWVILEKKAIEDNKIKNGIDVKQINKDSEEKEINKEEKKKEKLDDNTNENKEETKDEDMNENKEVNKKEIKEENKKENLGDKKKINKEESIEENKIEDMDMNREINKEDIKEENKNENEYKEENKELNKEGIKEVNKNEDINENRGLKKEECKEKNQILVNEDLNGKNEKIQDIKNNEKEKEYLVENKNIDSKEKIKLNCKKDEENM